MTLSRNWSKYVSNQLKQKKQHYITAHFNDWSFCVSKSIYICLNHPWKLEEFLWYNVYTCTYKCINTHPTMLSKKRPFETSTSLCIQNVICLFSKALVYGLLTLCGRKSIFWEFLFPMGMRRTNFSLFLFSTHVTEIWVCGILALRRAGSGCGEGIRLL